MADYTYEEVMGALRNADAAGDEEAAQRFADMARQLKQTQPAATPVQPKTEEKPSAIMDWFKDITQKSMTPTYSGSKTSRLIEGAIDPIMGVAALGANAAGFGDEVNPSVKRREEQLKQANEAAGVEGMDWMRLLGNAASPVNAALMKGATTVAAPINNVVARSAATGASLGLAQPAVGENYWTEKAGQAAMGAVVGPAVEGLVTLGGKIANIAYTTFSQKGRDAALSKYLNSLAGPNRDEVIRALQDSQELVTGSKPTAAEVLADLPHAVDLLRKQAELSKKQGLAGIFEQRAASNQAARVRALKEISGTEAQRARVAAARSASTNQTREVALNMADEARVTLKTIDDQMKAKAGQLVKSNDALNPRAIDVDERFVDVLPTDPALFGQLAKQQATDLKKLQLRSLAQNGMFPVYTKDLASKIDDSIAKADSDQTKAVLTYIKSKITEKADENGIIGSRDLYENIRKPSNQEIAKLLGLGDQFASGGLPQQAAKAVGETKKMIDEALDSTTGGLWTKYLADYSKFSQKLNRMEVGDYLVNRLNQPGLDKERIGVFATAVENAASTVKKSTGIPRYDRLDQVLTKAEKQTVDSVVADLRRLNKSDVGSGSLGPVTEDPAKLVPPWFSAYITLFKEVLSGMYAGNTKAANEKMAKLFVEPEKLAYVMSQQSVEQNKVLGKLFSEMASEPNKRALTQAFTVPQVAQSRNRE